MRYLRNVLGTAVAIALVATGSAEAAPKRPPDRPPSKGAPGPIAGAGLPFLAAAGIYWLIRRRMALGDENTATRRMDSGDGPRLSD